ncbi:MAG TPA: S9 family peptidase [Thermomicrobiales bacterium]|nr:S9 family peptidase [Thermomicrobiales bacterium]
MTDDTVQRIAIDDIYRFKLISEPRFSPDGSSVAYVVTTIEREKNDYRSSIYFSTIDGSRTRRMTRADAKDSLPRWSPDGKHVAFLSDRSEKSQIWVMRADGGESWQVSTLVEGISGFEWSPDGTRFVAVSKTVAGQVEEKDDPDKSDVRRVTKLRYRADGEGFLDQKPKHLWIVPAFDGESRQLTSADISDVDPIWSPNGREIAFVTNRTDGRESNTVSEVWSIVSPGGAERRIGGGDTASFHSPSWSPDGTSLAVIGNWNAAGGGALDDDVWIVPAGGGELRNLSAGFSRSITDAAMSDVFAGSVTRPAWSPDGENVLVLVSDSGSTHVYSASSGGGEVSPVTHGPRRVSALAIDATGDRIAYVAGDAADPGDLYIANVDGSDERRLTRLNEEFLTSIQLSIPEEFTAPSQSDGHPIHGWVLKPVGFEPDQKYPMILQIHGGPHGMYANHMMHEFQVMAARGYVVVYTNPRGSAGYGEEFTAFTHAAWGEKDMPDVMAAVDWVVKQGYVDETRLGVTGGSYGGYMTLWVIGHTDRFRAAVTQRCVSNLYSFYGTSDIGFSFGEYEFQGVPWERQDHFLKYSPISYVADMTTPLLIVHSEEDYRCPIEQAEQVFASLKRLGRQVEMVRFPNENHNLSRTGKPKHRVERLEHIIGWFDKLL